MSRIFHIYGPPGTGKTHYLSRQAKSAVQSRGSRSVAIFSLTRAAAKEISGRDTQVDENNVGTLHAHAHRALNSPAVAEAHINEFNEICPSFFRLTDSKRSMVDAPEGGGGDSEGDELMSRANILRANMVPFEQWQGTSLRNFYSFWCDWKRENSYMDFMEMIEVCINDVAQHPAKPSVMLGDEAQDWSKLEARLFRDVWGQHADTVIMACDEDQALYEWRGADPHIFSGNPIPEENTKILDQSYRVPRAVHKVAQKWIRQITDRRDVEYNPKDEPGEVELMDNISYKDLSSGDFMAKIKRILDTDETVMILASCGYMVNTVCKFLRSEGLPFHNPYRTQNGAWNPLRPRKGTVTSSDRLYAFLNPDDGYAWTKESLQYWIAPLGAVGLLRRGMKEVIQSGDFKVPTTASDWVSIFKNPDDIDSVLNLDIGWFQRNIMGSKSKSMDYPIQIARKMGKSQLTKRPQIIVGTIHSVKGGEADHVMVFPDIGYQSMQGLETDEGVVRMMYVAFTRAKKTLTLCGRSTRSAVEWMV